MFGKYDDMSWIICVDFSLPKSRCIVLPWLCDIFRTALLFANNCCQLNINYYCHWVYFYHPRFTYNPIMCFIDPNQTIQTLFLKTWLEWYSNSLVLKFFARGPFIQLIDDIWCCILRLNQRLLCSRPLPSKYAVAWRFPLNILYYI